MAQSVLSVNTERASRRMLFVLEKYKEQFPNEPLPLDPGRVALWAYDEGLWVPRDTDPREILRRKLCSDLGGVIKIEDDGGMGDIQCRYLALVWNRLGAAAPHRRMVSKELEHDRCAVFHANLPSPVDLLTLVVFSPLKMDLLEVLFKCPVRLGVFENY
jgi:hypothetical protein